MSNQTLKASDRIRNALKLAGYKQNQVTVKEPHWGDVKVTIRSADVRISAIKEIAKREQNVCYCESTGEILLGGNTFVDVAYSKEVLAPFVQSIEATLNSSNGQVVCLGSIRVSVDTEDQWTHKVWRWSNDDVGAFYCVGIHHAATRLAAELLDTGVKT